MKFSQYCIQYNELIESLTYIGTVRSRNFIQVLTDYSRSVLKGDEEPSAEVPSEGTFYEINGYIANWYISNRLMISDSEDFKSKLLEQLKLDSGVSMKEATANKFAARIAAIERNQGVKEVSHKLHIIQRDMARTRKRQRVLEYYVTVNSFSNHLIRDFHSVARAAAHHFAEITKDDPKSLYIPELTRKLALLNSTDLNRTERIVSAGRFFETLENARALLYLKEIPKQNPPEQKEQTQSPATPVDKVKIDIDPSSLVSDYSVVYKPGKMSYRTKYGKAMIALQTEILIKNKKEPKPMTQTLPLESTNSTVDKSGQSASDAYIRVHTTLQKLLELPTEQRKTGIRKYYQELKKAEHGLEYILKVSEKEMPQEYRDITTQTLSSIYDFLSKFSFLDEEKSVVQIDTIENQKAAIASIDKVLEAHFRWNTPNLKQPCSSAMELDRVRGSMQALTEKGCISSAMVFSITNALIEEVEQNTISNRRGIESIVKKLSIIEFTDRIRELRSSVTDPQLKSKLIRILDRAGCFSSTTGDVKNELWEIYVECVEKCEVVQIGYTAKPITYSAALSLFESTTSMINKAFQNLPDTEVVLRNKLFNLLSDFTDLASHLLRKTVFTKHNEIRDLVNRYTVITGELLTQ